MSTYRSPDVYNKEIDASLYVKGAATSVAGMVGITERGPVGVPVLVTSWPQFQEVFGSYLSASYLPHAAKSFFDEGGGVLYVARTAHYTDITDASTLTAVRATVDIDDGLDTVITVDASGEGTWANGLQVQVENVVAPLLDFSVLDADDNLLERFQSVSLDSTDARYIENIVNIESLYVDVTVVDPAGVPVTATPVALAGGNDGLVGLVDADYIGDGGGRTGLYAFDVIDTIKIVSVPGVSSEAVHLALASYAEGRETMFAVLGASQAGTPTSVLAHRAALDGTYSGLYWPWVRIANPQTGVPMLVPPDGHVLGSFARSDQAAGVWAAPAGLDRGRLRTALGVEYDTTRGERDELYDKGVNVIANFPGKGTAIWGQKTLTGRPSALDRVNVRRLLNFIKESAKDTTKYLLFEPNDERTWAAFIRYMDPFLANIKTRRGLMDYHIVCDETTNTPYYIDRNTMVAKIYVKPTRTAEFIELQYIVTGSGADFSEL